MPIENRTISLADWPAPHDPSSNQYNCPRWTDVNAWQDRGTRGRLFSETATWAGWRGCMWQYGQFATIATGNTAFWFLRNPYYELEADGVKAFGYDKDLNTLNRIVLVQCWAENTAAELPKGAGYDPDTFALAPTWHLWWTGAGATDPASPALPAGDFWTPWANTYMFALNDGSCMCFRNETGGELDLCMTMYVFEQASDGDYAEKRVWNQNPYRSPPADGFNVLQDRYIQARELDSSTLAPTNALEGASLHYGQFTYPTGALPLTAIDALRDWRNRPMLSFYVRHANLNEQPGGAAYDPDAFVTAARKLWYTQAGADPAAPAGGPPADFCWTPEANMWIFAARLALGPLVIGDLGVRNGLGAATYGMLLNIGMPDAS